MRILSLNSSATNSACCSKTSLLLSKTASLLPSLAKRLRFNPKDLENSFNIKLYGLELFCGPGTNPGCLNFSRANIQKILASYYSVINHLARYRSCCFFKAGRGFKIWISHKLRIICLIKNTDSLHDISSLVWIGHSFLPSD